MEKVRQISSAAVRVQHTDVVVVGGALAGLAAAISAREAGADVTLLSKGKPGKSGCTLYIGGYITWCPPGKEDVLEQQIHWTGGYLGDRSLIQAITQGIGSADERLIEWGLSQDTPGALENPGALELKTVTGKPKGFLLGQVMAEQAESAGVTLLKSMAVISLLATDDGQVCGVLAVDLSNDELVAIQGAQVVLATGGGARAFSRTDNPKGTTGDGFLLALQAGAELIDMELINFNYPLEDMRKATEAGPQIIGNVGSAHYFLGGIRIDATGKTAVAGLLAAGEVTGGILGAARLGGSALADCLVFGFQAGMTAASNKDTTNVTEDVFDKALKRGVSAQLERLADNRGDFAALQQQIQSIAWYKAGVVKDERTLQEALGELLALDSSVQNVRGTEIKDLATIHELHSIYYTALVCTKAALLRRETRGNFWRSDYPQPDPMQGMYNSVTVMTGQKVTVTQSAVTPCTEDTFPLRVAPGCLGYDFTID